MKIKMIKILLACWVLLLVSCRDHQDPEAYVVKLNTGGITVSEFEENFIRAAFGYDIEKALESTYDQRRRFLNDMVSRRIILDLIDIHRPDTLRMVQKEYQHNLNYQAIVNGLFADSLVSKLFTEDDIVKRYEQKKISYHPKHILIDVSKHGDSVAKKKINDIYSDLAEGTDFDSLARNFSDDVKTGVNGGSLGWIYIYDLIEDMRDQLKTLDKGNYTEPFLSRYGYHILYLEDIRNNQLNVFEAERHNISEELLRENSARFNFLHKEMLIRLFDRYGAEIHSDNIELIASRNDPDSFDREERSAPVASYSDLRINTGEILEILKRMPSETREGLNLHEEIKTYALSRFRDDLMRQYAEDLGYTEREDIVLKAREMTLDILRKALVQNIVRSKLDEPGEDEIRDYYESNIENYRKQDGTITDLKSVRSGIRNAIRRNQFDVKRAEWEKEIYEYYVHRIDHVELEKTLYRPGDERK